MSSSGSAKAIGFALTDPIRNLFGAASVWVNRLPGMQIPAGSEAQFKHYKAKRFLQQRRVAALCAAFFWFAFIYWDYKHWSAWHAAILGTYSTETFATMLVLRFVGTALLALMSYRLWTNRSFGLDDDALQLGFSALVMFCWFATLVLIWLTPPANVLVYYQGLPIIYLFLFCMLGIAPLEGAVVGVVCLLAFVATGVRGHLRTGEHQL